MSESRAPINHAVKCIQPYFEELWDGRKTFEIRVNDRDYREGDTIAQREYVNGAFTERMVRACIGYVTDFEQQPGFVVFSLLGSFRDIAESP